MKTNKTHFSIKLISGLSQVFFWFFAAVSSIFIVFILLNALSITPERVNIGFKFPTSFRVIEQGTLNSGETIYNVKVTKATGDIMILNAPRRYATTLSLTILPVLAAFLYMLWLFKCFTKNVRQGNTFKPVNIRHLKIIAYLIAGTWLYFQTIASIFSYFMVSNLSFNSLRFEPTYGFSGGMLLFALFIWVLSHIFQKGAEIEEENLLTV